MHGDGRKAVMPETSGIHGHSRPEGLNRPGGSLTILITPWIPDYSGVTEPRGSVTWQPGRSGSL